MMNSLITTLVAVFVMSFSCKAQSNFNEQMTQAFDQWNGGNTHQATTSFKEIAQAEKDNWLPYYYASLLEIIDSFPETDVAKKERLLQDAQQMLNKAREMDNDKTELMILQAMLHTSRLTMNPEKYGMELSPVISQIYAEALKISPDNPRVVLSNTEWNMGAAKYFGEDPANYCSAVRKSLELFKEKSLEGKFAPNWGKERAEALMATTCKN